MYFLTKSRSFPQPVSTIKTSPTLKLKWTQFSFKSKGNVGFKEIIMHISLYCKLDFNKNADYAHATHHDAITFLQSIDTNKHMCLFVYTFAHHCTHFDQNLARW